MMREKNGQWFAQKEEEIGPGPLRRSAGADLTQQAEVANYF